MVVCTFAYCVFVASIPRSGVAGAMACMFISFIGMALSFPEDTVPIYTVTNNKGAAFLLLLPTYIIRLKFYRYDWVNSRIIPFVSQMDIIVYVKAFFSVNY